jgi:hypothetical protein
VNFASGSFDFSEGQVIPANNFYLNRPGITANRLWVTLNGYRLFDGVDFTVQDDYLILASGTISTARFTMSFDSELNMIFNGLFTFMTFTTACVTGYIKIFHIQEKLEECIRLRQDWVTFGSAIASELQLPVELRHDALYVITKNKLKYLDLLKARPDVPEWCVKKAKKELAGSAGNVNLDATNLAHTIMDIAKQEMTLMDAKVDDASQTSSMSGFSAVPKSNVRAPQKAQVNRDPVQKIEKTENTEKTEKAEKTEKTEKTDEVPQSLTLTVGKPPTANTATNTIVPIATTTGTTANTLKNIPIEAIAAIATIATKQPFYAQPTHHKR